MSQYHGQAGPYAGPPAARPVGPGGYPVGPAGYPVVRATPKYRPSRLTALISIAMMGLTAIVAVIQSIALWSSYEDVKRFVYGLLSENEIDRGARTIAGTGPLLDLAGYLFAATGIIFLVWLWQARENTEAIKPAFAASYQGGYNSHSATHRHAPGWIVGGWFCPIIQFWYPLQVIEDVARASEPEMQPAGVRSGELRKLLYGWWGSWTAFWVIIVGGGGFAVVSFLGWMIRVADRIDAADATGDYVDIYDLQDYMVRVALAVNIGFTIATVLLIAAGVMISLLLLRITTWQDTRAKALGLFPPPHSAGPTHHAPTHRAPGHYRPGQHAPALPGQVPPGPVAGQVPLGHYPPGQPPQYAPRPGFGAGQPAEPPRSFPSYGGQQQHGGGVWQGPN
ncbi:MAG TPA: DUF4328 domain-containing protein [Kribbella sp.]